MYIYEESQTLKVPLLLAHTHIKERLSSAASICNTCKDLYNNTKVAKRVMKHLSKDEGGALENGVWPEGTHGAL